jgi:hypothetical protein
MMEVHNSSAGLVVAARDLSRSGCSAKRMFQKMHRVLRTIFASLDDDVGDHRPRGHPSCAA